MQVENIVRKIKKIYPDVQDHEFELIDPADGGGPTFVRWDYAGGPAPTFSQLQAHDAVVREEMLLDFTDGFAEGLTVSAGHFFATAARMLEILSQPGGMSAPNRAELDELLLELAPFAQYSPKRKNIREKVRTGTHQSIDDVRNDPEWTA